MRVCQDRLCPNYEASGTDKNRLKFMNKTNTNAETYVWYLYIVYSSSFTLVESRKCV